ncbi:unnamed protein product [Paramecium sonneborni]|uniref:MSP domain-containing protein n=1 Tax=Paramecium sonneborni TaxID=65129 RepID=A0A8S1RE43_9CILI|nr:unnamed protein product [Paramecium sonneborni]
MQNIIEIDPQAILEFVAEENRLGHAQLTLKNLRQQQIAFKIKTTVPQLFQVKPSVGVIESDQSMIIEISTTQAIKQNQKFDAKFQINACVKNSNEQDLSTFWINRDQSTIQTLLLKSKLKYDNSPQDQQIQQQQQNSDSKILESSVFNSTHSDSKMFKSIKEESQQDEQLKQYKEQLDKLSQEYQFFKNKFEQNQLNSLQMTGI